ncbi:hypothetical protein AWV79_09850 [Cupriavidus sp. UYMMa02A]|nr:hypothetical protein AWV79_09850 [Cupriavidus sp. UYMMa02A]
MASMVKAGIAACAPKASNGTWRRCATGRDSRGNWHQGGVSRYGDASTSAETLRDEWGTGRRRQPVGPKGYQRSDARIQEDLCQQLAYSRFDVSEVEVKVAEGVVTLGGEVGERADKFGIEEIADGVFGVREVDNQIRTPRAQGMPRTQP